VLLLLTVLVLVFVLVSLLVLSLELESLLWYVSVLLSPDGVVTLTSVLLVESLSVVLSLSVPVEEVDEKVLFDKSSVCTDAFVLEPPP
jgi:hypothetical protein